MGLRVPQGCAVSRTTWLRLGVVFGPLFLMVVLMRLVQYSITVRTDVPPLGLILLSAALTPLLLLLASIAVYAWLRTRWPQAPPVWHFLTASLLTVTLLVTTSVLAPPWVTEWITLRAFEAIRWDVLLLLLLALVFLFLLEGFQGWKRTACLVILYALTPLLMFLPAGSFIYFVSTGSPADLTLLKYFLLHLPDLTSIVSSELHGLRVLLLFTPLLILLPPLLLLRFRVVRRWAYAPTEQHPTGRPWHVLLGALPVILLLAALPPTSLPEAYPPSIYVNVMQELGVARPSNPVTARYVHEEMTPPFDTQGLRLAATDSTRRMNVVLILLESMRARSVTPYNPSLGTTPFLDSLARHALMVEAMYAVVPYTNKSLTPILAGIYPYPHREIIAARPGGIPGPGLPELLKPYGYRSAFFSAATLAYERKDQILHNLGFDEMWGGDALASDKFAQTNYFGSEDRVLLAPSLAWVDARTTAKEPFFLSYLTLVTHHPYAAPPTFEQHDFGVTDPALNAYLNAIHYTDAFLRDLFRAFAERNLLESTLFIISGDHGQAFGEHKQRMHADVLWDEALHVPTILYNPILFPKAGRIAGARQQIDFLPTIADALNMKPVGGLLPGSSLLRPVPPGRTLYFSGWESDMVLAMRQDDLKFMCRYKRCAMQVFDTRKDPLEKENIASMLPQERREEAVYRMHHWRQRVRQIYTDHLRQLTQ